MTAVLCVAHQDLFEKHPVAFDHARFRKVLLEEMFQNLGLCVGGREESNLETHGVIIFKLYICLVWFAFHKYV